MRILGNILWHIPFLGFLFAFGYFIFGLILCCTIILLPLGLGYFQMAKFMLAPFSYRLVNQKELVWIGRRDNGTAMKAFSLVIRILYFPLGLIAAISTIFLIVGEFISILGIPCALVWAKLFPSIFNPINKVCILREDAELIDRRKAESRANHPEGKLVMPPNVQAAKEPAEELAEGFWDISINNLKKAPVYMVPVVAALASCLFGTLGMLVAGIGCIIIALNDPPYRIPFACWGAGLIAMIFNPIVPLLLPYLGGAVIATAFIPSVLVIAGSLVAFSKKGMTGTAWLLIFTALLLYFKNRMNINPYLHSIHMMSGPSDGIFLGGIVSSFIVNLIICLPMAIGFYLAIAHILAQKNGFQKFS